MTPTRTKIHPLLGLAVAFLAGCGTTRPPLTELEEAGAAIDHARAADAATYAPVELRLAAAKLERARAAAAEKDYDAALQLAGEAEVDAELALAASRSGRARAEVQKQGQENASLRAELLGEGDAP